MTRLGMMRPDRLRNAAALPRPWAGFTLTELLVTMAIAGILATLAAPSFNGIIEKNRAKGASTDLFLALLQTRSEAVRRNTDVTLAPKSGDWGNGWQITLVDATVMEDHNALSGVTVDGPASVVYNSSGRVEGASASFDILSTGSTAVGRCVTVDPSGRPYTEDASC